MKIFTYNDYMHLKVSISHTYLNMINEESLPYSNELSEVNDIHDKSYRDLFNNANEFSLFLKYFLNCDFGTKSFIKCNNSFLTNDFKNRCSDIVYKLENEPVYFFVEHQSNKDESINYRIFNYYSLLLYDTIDFQKIKHKDYKFPIIVPVLLYTGKNKWNLVPNVGDKQTNYDLLNNKKINLYYDFIDIHNYTSKELLDSNSTIAYIMATDKCKDEKDLYSILTKLSEIHLTNEQKETIQRFIFFIYNKYFSKDTKNQLISKFNKKEDIKMSVLLDDVSSNMKTTLRDGISKGISSVVKKMLNNGESTEKIILYTGYSKKQIEKIKHEIGLI